MSVTETRMAARPPLPGLKVLDLSRILAGPLVGQMLADLGCDVVKVERPGKGDDAREMGPPFLHDRDGQSTTDSGFFLSCNRGKRSITLDLRRDPDQAVARRLAAQADIVVENFKLGTLARYGLDYATLAASNPRLIYCSITGFGQTGPYAPKPGYDGVFQAMGGLMSVSGHPPGQPGAGPMKVGISMVDILTSYNAVIAIQAALYHRDAPGAGGGAGGIGQHIDISLLDCGIASLSHFAQNYLISGVVPERRGNGGYGGIPSQAFDCADRPIFLVAGNNDQYRRLCDAIGRPALATDPRFASGPDRIRNRIALIEILGEIFIARDAAAWVALLDAAGVPVSRINNMAEMFADPQVQSRGLVVEVEHARAGRMPVLANPLRFSATPVAEYRAPPVLGEHSAEVLRDWLGLADAQPDERKALGIV